MYAFLIIDPAKSNRFSQPVYLLCKITFTTKFNPIAFDKKFGQSLNITVNI